ncbi:MBL fold metallo-hydrolase [Chroococcus sp. FPU101]|uniref:MBL fold metallo-hydrolase n=1 Tax=Chroococcus sp. FPU101 TaxID=1974212 RepID=UPI001A902D92|nr:MBL fold metallo-hydrolase [Chroococcus sp. FPU101]
MQRRKLLQYAGISCLSMAGTLGASSIIQAQTKPAKTDSGLTVQWLGHTCFLFTGSGYRILVNPFRTIGCTAGYRLPKVEADFVLISSQLWDEGAAENLPGNPKILFEPGVYEIKDFKIQGIASPHDRQGGRRFGTNVAWRWTQGGIKIVHLGGAASPIALEQKILLGTPDLALVPVGGGPKAYNPEEAQQAISVLQPKIVIPTQFMTVAADKNSCDLVSVDAFLKLEQVSGMNVQKIPSDTLRIRPSDLPKTGTVIRVLNSTNALAQKK